MTNHPSKTSTDRSLVWLIILVAIALVFVSLGPEERTLGVNIRSVYLHGAWVWTSIIIFLAAGVTGLLAVITHLSWTHDWSQAFGRTGLLFWITYLPVSMWAMKTNWNGLYLAEPRWRLAVIFAVTGLLLQIGLTLIDRRTWTSAGNLIFITILMAVLSDTREVMHPNSPIFSSDSLLIQAYFITLVSMMLLIAWQIVRSWLYFDRKAGKRP